MADFVAKLLERLGSDAVNALAAKVKAWIDAWKAKRKVQSEEQAVLTASTQEELDRAADQNRKP